MQTSQDILQRVRSVVLHERDTCIDGVTKFAQIPRFEKKTAAVLINCRLANDYPMQACRRDFHAERVARADVVEHGLAARGEAAPPHLEVRRGVGTQAMLGVARPFLARAEDACLELARRFGERDQAVAVVAQRSLVKGGQRTGEGGAAERRAPVRRARQRAQSIVANAWGPHRIGVTSRIDTRRTTATPHSFIASWQHDASRRAQWTTDRMQPRPITLCM